MIAARRLPLAPMPPAPDLDSVVRFSMVAAAAAVAARKGEIVGFVIAVVVVIVVGFVVGVVTRSLSFVRLFV